MFLLSGWFSVQKPLSQIQRSTPSRFQHTSNPHPFGGFGLKRRNPGEEALHKNISAYEAERNAAGAMINLRFTTKEARATLCRLYPYTSVLTQH